jgi:hypothetical protein
MNLNGPRAALALVLVLAVGVGAGCGSSSSKTQIKDAAFIGKCVDATKKELTGAAKGIVTEAQLRQACVCAQKKLVSQGYGDKDVNGSDIGETGRRDGADCARQVLTGK